MQNFNAINLLNTPENLFFPPGNSPANINERAVTDHSFENLLLNQLNNSETGHNEEIQSRNIEKDPLSKSSTGKEEPVNKHENQTTAYSQNTKPDERIDSAGNENIQKKDNKSNPDDDKQNDKIKKEISGDTAKGKGKVPEDKIRNDSDILIMLKDINIMLKMTGLSLNIKEIQEIKSIFTELRNNILNKDKEITSNVQVKGLLEKLKKFFDAKNGRMILKSGFPQKYENKSEPFESLNIKKQISKLVNEIREHLNEGKSETAAGKTEDFNNVNKNTVNQKILSEYPDIEKKEISSAKDNTTNFSFQFLKKTVEGNVSSAIKNNAPAMQKRNAFNEQLNNLIQNAKISIKDGKNGSFSIRLYPESLGRVNVNLNLEHGVILGKFLVDNAEAREVLLENMYVVKEKLQENGVAVGEFQVNVRGGNNPFPGSGENRVFYNTGVNSGVISPGNEYELYSSYLHDGEIDLLI